MKKKEKRFRGHTESFIKKQRARQDRFLVAFRKVHMHNKACEAAGVSDDAVWDWRNTDPEFEKRYLEAEASVGRAALDEAFRRAVQGYPTGVYYEGKLVATEIEYSDMLLARMLAAHDKRFRGASADDGTSVVPNVTVITYASPNTNPNHPSPQLRPETVPAPHIKSYR